MSSRAEPTTWRARWIAVLLCALFASACYESHPCGRERCDGKDNDCDGKLDEDFTNDAGVFASEDNCGGCGVRCADVFPTAASTACMLEDGGATCVITQCPSGEVMAGEGACVTSVPVACLPCSGDDECDARSPGARCFEDAMGGKHCAPRCSDALPCTDGFACRMQTDDAFCLPASGACACDASMEGAEFACELRAPDPMTSVACAGLQRCASGRLGSCEPALEEACNGADDDCDGKLDEDFVDDAMRYVTAEHCGSCGEPCAVGGEHASAECRVENGAAVCVRGCEAGWVDRDGFATNGCECELLDASKPRANADGDCDGQIDPSPPLVFVSPAGDDSQAGTSPDAPVRTLARGAAIGAMLGRDVLVARGVYAGPVTMPNGVAIRGGYSPDFTRQDSTLYPVVIEGAETLQGAPVLRCESTDQSTRVQDVTIQASAVTSSGQGSTAVFLDGCGPGVVLEGVTILAARASPGRAGDDASALVSSLGLASLSDLDGVTGGIGAAGGEAAPSCNATAGTGGAKLCPSGDVGGGRGGDARCAALSCANASGVPCGNAGCTDFTTAGTCDIASARAMAIPNPLAATGRGAAPGAAGVASYDAPTNHGICSFCDDNPSLQRLGDDGGDGARGADGGGGLGCASGVMIDVDGRVTAADGGSGSGGSDGSGGGGGSAGGGYARIGNTSGACNSLPGGAGGGGGSGGCGAPGGGGGGGGGGSLGVLIRLRADQTSGPQLLSVRIVTASGGSGGDGGSGAAGGTPGSGGLGGVSEFWCARSGGRGGAGGPGGAGGGGGGGCGGPSLGVYVAADGSVDPSWVEGLKAGLQVEPAGAAGGGGRAGFSPGQSGGAGALGASGDVFVE